MPNNLNIAVLILAAGESKRMGTPKQLLKWENRTLLGHTIEQIQELNYDIFVVLGANFDKVKSSIKYYPIHILHYKQWKKGLGSSIAFGVSYIIKSNKEIDAVLVILADQPLINHDYLKLLINKFSTKKSKIVASLYKNGSYGVPALFEKTFFKELCKLKDDKGAKALLQEYRSEVSGINAESLVFDIDTLDDYHILQQRTSKMDNS